MRGTLDRINPWPSYEEFKAKIQEHARLTDEVRTLQAEVRTATGLDSELLSPSD